MILQLLSFFFSHFLTKTNANIIVRLAVLRIFLLLNLAVPLPPPAVSTHTEGEEKIQVLLMVEGRRYDLYVLGVKVPALNSPKSLFEDLFTPLAAFC